MSTEPEATETGISPVYATEPLIVPHFLDILLAGEYA